MNAFPGEIYSHYAGGLVYVIGTGKDTETGTETVIFQPLLRKDGLKYGQSWVMPKEKFFSPVDKERYPDADQDTTYRVRELGQVEETLNQKIQDEINYWKEEARAAAQEAYEAGRRHDRRALEKIYSRILDRPDSI